MFKLSQLSFYNLLCRKVVICRNLYSHSLSLNCTFVDTVQHFNIAAVILSPWEEGFNACTSASPSISTMITIQNFCQLGLFYTNCYRTLGSGVLYKTCRVHMRFMSAMFFKVNLHKGGHLFHTQGSSNSAEC